MKMGRGSAERVKVLPLPSCRVKSGAASRSGFEVVGAGSVVEAGVVASGFEVPDASSLVSGEVEGAQEASRAEAARAIIQARKTIPRVYVRGLVTSSLRPLRRHLAVSPRPSLPAHPSECSLRSLGEEVSRLASVF